ncbi:MAG: prenyltransferase/squalene oxidase repeat-containing protein [Pirellulales bacterium]
MPGVLISLIVHTALLILLAIWTVRGIGRGGTAIEFEPSAREAEASDLEALPVPMQLGSGDSAPAPGLESIAGASSNASNTSSAAAVASLLSPSNNETKQESVKSDLKSAASSMIDVTSNSTIAVFGSSGVEGRSPGKRRQLALERGGSADSEAAVEAALDWLVAHQRPNGSWSLLHTKEACNGQCTHEGSKDRYDPAATGLALLAFLGAGYTHQEGKHAETVRRGVYYLLQVMEETPNGGSFLYSSPQGMYNHGIAAFALCEAYQLSGDETLAHAAQRAITFIATSQNAAGGWGYLPKQPGDLTITGWQTMTLKSGQSAGLSIPGSGIIRLDKFLDSQTDAEKIYYGYGVPGKRESCTSIALLLRMYRGWSKTDPRVLAGVRFVSAEGPSQTDMYRNYYATMLLFHTGGPVYEQWNKKMRDYLVQSQSRDGHAAGSWYFPDKYGDQGGRLYNTAMCAMILEVYYRFAPITMNTDRPFQL